MTTPDVSVVVISFNDAARLPRAIESVRHQTLRNLEIIVVDDASTDDTESVVRSLMAIDDRIRYERLDFNSGGCSAPRNHGMSLARAPWVMFCDSDDEYELHACKNLLIAAEATGAQVVCGMAERIDVATGKSKAWRPEVHESLRVEPGLAAFPELLYDTISVNKIYSRELIREHSLRFPEGLLFEDQLFTLEAMASAPVIASLPEVVYRWHVDRLGDEPSITQRRQEARNVADRVEVNRRIDAYLSARGLTALQAAKDVKFVRHDLYLYLSSILECEDQTARTLMEALAPYVQDMDPTAFRQARTGIRLAAYHLLVGDLEGIRSAMRFVRWASVVDVPVREVEGRELWSCEHVDHGPAACGVAAREWLDVTDLGLLRIPFSQRRFLHRVDRVSLSGDQVHIDGSSVDYDGSLSECDRIDVVFTAGGRPVGTLQGEWLDADADADADGDRRAWRASGRIDATPQVLMHVGERGSVMVEISRHGMVNRTAGRFDGDGLPSVSCGGASLALSRGANGSIAVAVQAVRELRGANRVRRLAVAAAARLIRPVATGRRPVVFALAEGRQACGSALAISRALHELRPDIPQAWLFRSDPTMVPDWAEAVRIGGPRNAWVRDFSAAFVSDGSLGSAVRAPRIDIGAGVPIHRVGLDAPDASAVRALAKAARASHRGASVLLSASEFSAEVERRAFAYDGALEVVGLPRMDAALASTRDDAKRSLDLPLDRAVVVYAPLANAAIDLDTWIETIGMRAYLVQVHGDSRTAQRAFVRDIDDSELSAAVAACDVFISDYSPFLGDAALADRSTILFQPDRLTFMRRTCGVYPGLDEVGPCVTDLPALVTEVSALLDDPAEWNARFAAARRSFAERRCGPGDGLSANRAVAVITRVAGLS